MLPHGIFPPCPILTTPPSLQTSQETTSSAATLPFCWCVLADLEQHWQKTAESLRISFILCMNINRNIQQKNVFLCLFAWRSILANGGKSSQFHVCDTIISVSHKMAAWENLLWNLMIFRPTDFCSCAVTLESLPKAFQCHLFSGGIRLSIEIETWNWVHNLTTTSQGGRTQPRVFTSHCKSEGFYRHLRPISTQCLKHRLNFEQESGSLVVLKALKLKIR